MSKMQLTNNDFLKSTNTVFETLRKDIDFTDVTLVCEDGHQVEANRVILAASSPFFDTMLRKKKHTNSLIYMRGMKSEDLLAIVDFLYYGEANIYQENLDTFLSIAEELDLKGINGKGGEGEEDQINSEEINTTLKPAPKKKSFQNSNMATEINASLSQSYSNDQHISSDMTVAFQKQEFLGDLKDLDDKIKTLMVQGENMVKKGIRNVIGYVCQVCGKESDIQNIKRHIEVNHPEGILITWKLCETTFRSRNAMRQHYPLHHANSC